VWDLETPVLELVARAAIIYVLVLLLMRVSGKRTVGEFAPFDLLVIILLGESAQAGLLGNETSVWGTLIVAATLVGLNLVASIATARSRVASRLLEGEPVMLARDGKPLAAALRRSHVPMADLEEAVREANLKSLSDVELAMLEASGKITIVPRRQ
jgi:uncharacterized membrane protein YcaP (DUF421 family)